MENIWKDLSCNLQIKSKGILVETETAGRGIVASDDFNKKDAIKIRIFFRHSSNISIM